ncbi:unnamed protein product [Adineta ricciae]|uniref:Uncharacterized protein n=1 Tax=Adineta ricciae TaxID=249248 RepID=A0A816ELZ1_ADIRI|nr:unnamed protein product [Adineta ricciae]CAF1654706.1 unnamed protein product [Adineta ricciae]
MNTCSFTFTSIRTGLPVHVTGVEQTWNQLKHEFKLHMNGLPSATYYKVIGPGPELFAVIDTIVFYQLDEHWHPYKTAINIEHGTMNIDE